MEFGHRREEPVVGCEPFDFLPDIFGGVEFGRIRRQIVNLYMGFLRLQPFPHFGPFVVRSVVSNKMDFCTLVVSNELSKECNEGIGVELLGEPEVPLGLLIHLDCAQGLDTLASWKAHDDKALTFEGPSTVDGSSLLKRRLVPVDQDTSLLLGFFFIRGNSSSIHFLCFSRSALQGRRLGS